MISKRRALFIGCLCSVTCCNAASAEPEVRVSGPIIRAVVSESNPPPYAFFSIDGKLSGGISKHLLDEVALRLRGQVEYLDVPRARVEPWLSRGKADVACFLSPQWVADAEQFDWTGPLFYTQQLIIRREGSPPIRAIMDLYRKRIGTTHGFRYPELDAAFASEQLIRDDAHSLVSNLQRLAQGRLDAVMTVDLTYGDLMKTQRFDVKFAADPLWSEPSPVFCAVSQSSQHRMQLLQAFSRLTSEGFFVAELKPYLPIQVQPKAN
jgi:polar amino acid transport system substrate-binding protein